MMKWVLFLCCWLPVVALATHNRSGEITYRHINGNTYEFTITTCTKLSSEANRDELEIDFGDGIVDTLPLVEFENYPNTDSKKNVYRGNHTFTGAGTYLISVTDPNRNANVVNINFSVDQIFCIQTELIISPFLGAPNNSVVLEDCPCPEEACTDTKWSYNSGAYDPDGDSLAYELIVCKGEDCKPMPVPQVFQFPGDAGGGSFSVNSVTGTISWDAPQVAGEYNFALKISEYRLGVEIGFVIRDMQVTVMNCNNNPPKVEVFSDTCVEAGALLQDTVRATDVSSGLGDVPSLEWEVFGEGFNLTNPAVFSDTLTPGNPIVGFFSWQPSCADIRNQAYLFSFKAEDNGPFVQLKDIETVAIQVSGPPVDSLTLTTGLGNNLLRWHTTSCSNVQAYQVYRFSDSLVGDSVCCDNGVALDLGYELIGTTESDTFFIDTANLVVGNKYCYAVSAIYGDGVESCLSKPVCLQLPFDVPVLTKVSVGETGIGDGSDTVAWVNPVELDTTLFTGPYSYRLFRSVAPDFPNELIFVSSSTNFLFQQSTEFLDTALNTASDQHSYRVQLLSDGVPVGSSVPASSLFLEAIPNDNQIELTWEPLVPWNNFAYEVSRSNDTNFAVFTVQDTVLSPYFLDDSLINGQEFCYRIRSFGRYSHDSLTDTLINYSQVVCTAAFDFTAPCAPSSILVEGDCVTETNRLTWVNPNNSCADDVVGYQLYYTPTKNGTFEKIAEITSADDTIYLFEGKGSIAGCFYVTASDSVPYNNQSEPSEVVCVDNCDAVYVLPNVFTPNGDGANDVYHPLLPFQFVDRVEFTILNRWGDEVFYTTDPMINWDGKDQEENMPLLEGVYFYTGTAYGVKLNGEVPIELNGFIHLIYND